MQGQWHAELTKLVEDKIKRESNLDGLEIVEFDGGRGREERERDDVNPMEFEP